METTDSKKPAVLHIEAVVNAPVEKVWKFWTSPEHITKWNSPSPDWHTPRAENDLKAGGRFLSRMEAKDGSFGFDFSGTYTTVDTNKKIAYTLDDNRKVSVDFDGQGNSCKIASDFEAEEMNPLEMQQGGWQAILNSFKAYAESN
jgi:uncharacterized protein YndB with AHSA1/START domain